MPELVHGDAVFRVDPSTPRDYDKDNALLALLRRRREGPPRRRARVLRPGDAAAPPAAHVPRAVGPVAAGHRQPRPQDAGQQDRLPQAERPPLHARRHAGRARLGGGGRLARPVSLADLPRRAGPRAVARPPAGSSATRSAASWRSTGARRRRCARRTTPRPTATSSRSGAATRAACATRSARAGRRPSTSARSSAGRTSSRGGTADFERMAVDGKDMRGVATQHTMHPILPLYLDVHVDRVRRRQRRAGRPAPPRLRDARPRLGQLPLGRLLRQPARRRRRRSSTARCCRTTARYQGSGELSRVLEPWNFDAHGNKGHQSGDRENVHDRRLHGPPRPRAGVRHRPAPPSRQPGDLLHARRRGDHGHRRLGRTRAAARAPSRCAGSRRATSRCSRVATSTAS